MIEIRSIHHRRRNNRSRAEKETALSLHHHHDDPCLSAAKRPRIAADGPKQDVLSKTTSAQTWPLLRPICPRDLNQTQTTHGARTVTSAPLTSLRPSGSTICYALPCDQTVRSDKQHDRPLFNPRSVDVGSSPAGWITVAIIDDWHSPTLRPSPTRPLLDSTARCAKVGMRNPTHSPNQTSNCERSQCRVPIAGLGRFSVAWTRRLSIITSPPSPGMGRVCACQHLHWDGQYQKPAQSPRLRQPVAYSTLPVSRLRPHFLARYSAQSCGPVGL